MIISFIRTRHAGGLGLLALAVAGIALTLALLGSARGADHRDGPAAEGDKAADITDVYAFRSPANNDNLVIAFGVNGLTAPADNSSAQFSNDVSFQIHVDKDANLATDEATVGVSFSGAPGQQRFTISGLGNPISGDVTPPSRTSTPNAPKITEAGGIKAFAGQRDDAFFFDLTAFKKFVAGPYVPAQGLRAAADGAPADTFAGTNVSYVVIELPITAVTGESSSNTGIVRAWVSSLRGSTQVDRMAIPAINTALIPSDQKDAFNGGSPGTDASAFQATGKNTMDGLRSAVDAVLAPAVGAQDGGPLGNLTSQQVAEALIPDIVTIDFSKDVVFPNGRRLQDDVIDTALQLVLNRTTGITDAINANDKAFGNAFPYLADPNQPAATPTPPPAALPPTGGETGDNNVPEWLLAVALLGGALLTAGGALFVRRRVIR